jgi:hypothetical protein
MQVPCDLELDCRSPLATHGYTSRKHWLLPLHLRGLRPKKASIDSNSYLVEGQCGASAARPRNALQAEKGELG